MFNVSLDLLPATPDESTRFNAKDFQSLVMEACELLATTSCRFHMGGFGSDEWAVGVAYDLSVVTEQLPDVLAALRSNSYFELDLYSQGLERTIIFVPLEGAVELKCHSRTTWVPYPQTESADRERLIARFEKLAISFGSAAALIHSEPLSCAALDRWQIGLV